MAQGIDKIAQAGLSRMDRIRWLWQFFGEVRSRHPEYFQVFFYLAHPQATASVSDEVKADLARRSGDTFRRFTALLRDGEDDPSARLAADLLWSTFAGLVVLRDSRENLGVRAHPTDRELVSALELMMTGLLADEGGRR